jgi:hypothetical protein
MKKVFFNTLVLFIALAACTSAYSQKKTDKKTDKKAKKETAKAPAKDIPTLSYKFIDGKDVKYKNTTKMIQNLDINGQTMEINVNDVFGFSVKSKGIKEGNILLEVRIDTMAQSMDSPQGSAGGNIADAAGKVFNIVLSPSGNEVDLSEAKQIVINTEGFGPTDASQPFIKFFPDLPTGTITPGYTWTTIDSLDNRTATAGEKVTTKSDNKFEGFEIVDGVNCAKISSAISGKRIQNVQTQGMDLVINGTYTGTGIMYFLVDGGYFLKETVTSKLTGMIDITSQGMSFPIVIDNTSVKEVIK